MASNTSNASTNLSMGSFEFPGPFVILMRTQGSIIVLLNLLVLGVLTIKKNNFPAVYWLQIVCLAFNDLLAGIANFIVSFMDKDYFSKNLTNCCIATIFTFSSQSASLYNIFGICVHRFIVLKQNDVTYNVWKHRHTVLCTCVAWTISISLCSLPVFVYNKPEVYSRAKVCSLVPIFGQDIRKGSLILMGSFIFPLIFTNIIYIALFCILRNMWKKVRPSTNRTNEKTRSAHFAGESVQHSSSDRTAMLKTFTNQPKSAELQVPRPGYRASAPTQNIAINNQSEERKSTNFHPLNINGRNDRNEAVTSISLTQASSDGSDCLSHTRIPSKSFKSERRSKVRSNIPTVVLRQRKAFALLGIILLFLNIFSWPGISALLLTSMVDSISLDRNTLLPLFTTICFNSVVNPILYTATIPEFRSALLEIVLNVYRLCKC